MAHAVQYYHLIEAKMKHSIIQFENKHPYIALWGAFVGIPIALLAAVTAFATIVILPFACIFGWL